MNDDGARAGDNDAGRVVSADDARAPRALRRALAGLERHDATLDAAVAAADTLLTHDLTPAARDVARTLQGALQALRTETARLIEGAAAPSQPPGSPRSGPVLHGQVVEAALAQAAALAAVRGVIIDLVVDPGLPRGLHVDEDGLRRAVDDLIAAALTVTPTGGIVVRITGTTADGPGPSGRTLTLQVVVECAQRVFLAATAATVPSPFAIAAESARALGATLTVEPQDGGAPRALLAVPCAVADGAPLAEPVGSRRIGMVIDDDGLRERLESTLVQLGGQVLSLGSVAAFAEDTEGVFDVIFVTRSAVLRAAADELAGLDVRVRVPERDIIVIGPSGSGISTWASTRRTLLRPLGLDKLAAALRGEPFGRTTEAPASVLIVDDDADMREILRRFLAESGHRVLVAENGGDGVNTALAHPRPDLVLMDLEMPGLDGFGALEALRSMERHATLPPVPVVALTAHAYPDVAARLRDAGMRDMVHKPVRRARLLDVVAMHADHRPPMILIDDDERLRALRVAALGAQAHLRVVAVADVEEALLCIRDRRVRRVAVAVRRRGGGRESTRLALGVPARLAEVRNPPPRAVALLDAPDDWLRTAAVASGFSDALPVSDMLALAAALDGEASLLPQAALAEDEARAFVDDDLVDLVGPFLRRQQAELERAHQGLEAGAFEDVRRIGHRLRGTAGSFGLDELAAIGQRLEHAASARDAPAARSAAVEARRLVATVRVLPRSSQQRR